MTLQDKILTRLHTSYPQQVFGFYPEYDPLSGTLRSTLTINGVKTHYGFYPSIIQTMITQNGTKEDAYIDQFVNMVDGLQKLYRSQAVV